MLKRAAALLLVCASIAVWTGCGSTSNRYLYAAIPTSNEIVIFREDPASGGLIQLAGSPVTAGPGVQSLALHPSGTFLYAANSGQNNVSAYTVGSNGSIAEITRVNAGTAPTLAVMDPSGNFLYVGNSGSFDISVFAIDSKGTLTAVPQCTSTGTCSATAPIGLSALNMAVPPSGNFLYITGQQGLQGYIEVFPLSQGILGQPVAGSPFFTGSAPYGLAIASGTGNGFLYTANKLDNSISEFTINSDGSLKQLSNSPIGETFTSPVSLAVDKTGKFLFVANQGNGNLVGYSIGSDGSLQLVSGSPFITGTQPNVLAADPAGNFIFVGYGASSSSINSFSLDTSTGVLTSVATYSASGAGAPTSMVVRP